MATTTLDAMAAGGLYDHVGGGFARYSTDTVWLVPHFEKMLYDQALLVGAYLRGFVATENPRYREVVEETIDYVLRDLRHADGGFFSAEDADSEGIEGKFYLWSPDEIHARLRRRRRRGHPVLRRHAIGNFTDPHTGYSGSILAQVNRTEPRPDGVRRALPLLLAAAVGSGSARTRRQGADRMERSLHAIADRSRGRVRSRRLDGCGPSESRVPGDPAPGT